MFAVISLSNVSGDFQRLPRLPDSKESGRV